METAPAQRYSGAAELATAITTAIRPTVVADAETVIRFLQSVSPGLMHIEPPSNEPRTAHTVIDVPAAALAQTKTE
jgi:hypothetical protein